MNFKRFTTGKVVLAALVLSACATAAYQPIKAGLLEYGGSQKTIFEKGKAEPVVPLAAMSGAADLYAVGAVSGLDGEITVFQGRPYVTKVRGEGYTTEHDLNHHASFAVWARVNQWSEHAVPESVKGYVDLQNFVKERAKAAGIDVSQPFPFQVAGTPVEVKWHINVDRTDGKPVTPELFAKSKANYVAKNLAMDIVGFYSEQHPGVFISAFAPAIPPGGSARNAMHIHMVSRDGKSAGHVDNLVLGPGMVLRLPKV
ncbi:acetolactate decarboxylase [Tibeticola sp.]|uniref:acetolactate decarboxylase n=1 Tax=Tibeticola sp. TaxID=2005368 RepID=UPI0025E1642D|nr:acetolactate decarboxylase [Tibeticola sp.]